MKILERMPAELLMARARTIQERPTPRSEVRRSGRRPTRCAAFEGTRGKRDDGSHLNEENRRQALGELSERPPVQSKNRRTSTKLAKARKRVMYSALAGTTACKMRVEK